MIIICQKNYFKNKNLLKVNKTDKNSVYKAYFTPFQKWYFEKIYFIRHFSTIINKDQK